MKILAGIYSVEEGGEIVIDGSKVVFKGITHANEMGIYIIHQELNLVSELSIAENINLGKPYPMRKYGLINWEIIHSEGKKILKSLNLQLDPKTKVKELSVANQQMVEIAKVLSNKNPKLVIMDEADSCNK